MMKFLKFAAICAVGASVSGCVIYPTQYYPYYPENCCAMIEQEQGRRMVTRFDALGRPYTENIPVVTSSYITSSHNRNAPMMRTRDQNHHSHKNNSIKHHIKNKIKNSFIKKNNQK